MSAREALPVNEGLPDVTGLGKFRSVSGTPARNPAVAWLDSLYKPK